MEEPGFTFVRHCGVLQLDQECESLVSAHGIAGNPHTYLHMKQHERGLGGIQSLVPGSAEAMLLVILDRRLASAKSHHPTLPSLLPNESWESNLRDSLHALGASVSGCWATIVATCSTPPRCYLPSVSLPAHDLHCNQTFFYCKS